jgi:hypothetical protein
LGPAQSDCVIATNNSAPMESWSFERAGPEIQLPPDCAGGRWSACRTLGQHQNQRTCGMSSAPMASSTPAFPERGLLATKVPTSRSGPSASGTAAAPAARPRNRRRGWCPNEGVFGCDRSFPRGHGGCCGVAVRWSELFMMASPLMLQLDDRAGRPSGTENEKVRQELGARSRPNPEGAPGIRLSHPRGSRLSPLCSGRSSRWRASRCRRRPSHALPDQGLRDGLYGAGCPPVFKPAVEWLCAGRHP